MSTEVHGRWNAFLGKIQGAFDELMVDARAGCLQLLDLNQLDPIAMTNAWMGIRAEVFALSDKIDNTWREKVSSAFEGTGLSSPEMHAEEMRGRRLGEKLRLAAERAEIQIFAEAGDKILAAAQATLKRGFLCTECGAELPIPQHFFRSVHVPCPYCRGVNTFEPGTQVRMIEHFCSHHLSQRAALTEWDALKAVEQRRRDTRGDTLEVLEALEVATRAYQTAYFRARAALIPEFEKDLERDIEARMRPFRDSMANNPVWIAARRGDPSLRG
jgi:hypothetical protein